MLPVRSQLGTLSRRMRSRAPQRQSDLPAERPSFGQLVHATVAGLLGGSLLGAVLALLTAWIGYRPFDSTAFTVAAYAGLATGGWCGLAVAPTVLRARRPRSTAIVSTLVGAGVGILCGAYFGMQSPREWYPALAWLGGLAGGVEGLALNVAARALWKRWQVESPPRPASAETLPGAALTPGEQTALACSSGEAMLLRQRALRLGRATFCVRFGLPGLVAAIWIGRSLYWPSLTAQTAPLVIIEVVYLLPLVLGAALLGLPVSFALARLCRRWSVRRLRQQLAPLPLEEQRELLVGLHQSSAPEIREIASPLLREIDRRGTELSPASSTDGRGNELGA